MLTVGLESFYERAKKIKKIFDPKKLFYRLVRIICVRRLHGEFSDED